MAEFKCACFLNETKGERDGESRGGYRDSLSMVHRELHSSTVNVLENSVTLAGPLSYGEEKAKGQIRQSTIMSLFPSSYI